jgi:hypothetical protein
MTQSLYEIVLWTDSVQQGIVHMEYVPRVGEFLYFKGHKRHIEEVMHVLRENSRGGNDLSKVYITIGR